MKKILILAYAYPPFNHIGSQRPKSFADNFSNEGLYPVVVTRHYAEDGQKYEDSFRPDKREVSVITLDSHQEIRLPYYAKRYRLIEKFKKIPFAEFALLTAYALKGDVHVKTGIDEMASGYLHEYLTTNKVDYILVTTPPLNSIKLGSDLSKKFGIPLIVDFRDLWDNRLLANNYKPGFGKSIQNRIETSYLKKWLKQAKLITAVSEPILEEVRKLNSEADMMVVTNGFEEKIFDGLSSVAAVKNSKFTFSVIGTIYPEQDLSVLFDGMKLFLEGKDTNDIKLNFVGTGYNQQTGKMINENLPAQCTTLTGRLPRSEALQYLQQSDVLFHAGWRGFRGIASGKIFEYIGSKKKVLIAPGDNDIMEKIVRETGAGKIANTASEFAAALNEWFAEWKSAGYLKYTGDYQKVLQYSRENQAKALAKKILSLE